MKHHHFIIFALLGFLMLGCQDQLVLRDDAPLDEIATKAGEDEYTVQTNECYVFPSEKDFKAWTDIIGLENRFRACEVPENILRSMTTEALVQTVLKYPLNYIAYAYNTHQEVVNLFLKYSSLHRELVSRIDAGPTLLAAVLAVNAVLPHDEESHDNDLAPLVNVIIAEAFLAHKPILDSFSARGLGDECKAEIQRILNERLSFPEIYGSFSCMSLFNILDRSQGLRIQRSGLETTIYTPFNHPLTAEIRAEENSSVLLFYTNLYVINHPNATMVGVATATYNGNAYAWYDECNTNHVWLEDTCGGITQLSNYWTNDVYASCSSSDATKVYYSNSNHSAIKISTDRYRSKWNKGPLMEHDLDDIPYTTSGKQYYRVRTSPLFSVYTFYGPNTLPLDTMGEYMASTYSRINNVWSAECLSSSSPTAFEFSNPYSGTYRLTCHEIGAYKLHINGYYGSSLVARGEQLVVCTP